MAIALNNFRNRTVTALSATTLLVALLSLLIAPGASADVTIGAPGSGAGQYQVPSGVAVDRSNGTLYVADTGNNRVDVFEADGTFIRAFGWGVADGTTAALQTCTAVCFKGLAGTGPGQFSGISGIAVDNDPTSPAFHDVYTVGSSRVQRFTPAGEFVLTFGDEVNKTTKGDICTAVSGNTCGAGINGKGPGQLGEEAKIAIGSGGTVHVADDIGNGARLGRFDPTGAFLNQVAPLPPGDVEASRVLSLALDSSDNFYIVTNSFGSPVRKHDAAGNLLTEIPINTGNRALATDADSLYVAESINDPDVPNLGSHIRQYDSSGNLLRVLYSKNVILLRSLAAYSSPGGDIFGAEETGHQVLHIPLPAPGPAFGPGVLQAGEELPPFTNVSTKATQTGSASAVLSTMVNPEGKATTFRFEYVDQATFEAEGFANPTKTVEAAAVGSDFELHPVNQKVTGLSPETFYRFRAVASNADGSNTGQVASFETREPFEILAAWSTDVDSSSAILYAEMNPLGIPATGYFEYVDEATFQKSGFAQAAKTPNVSGGQSPIDFGAEEKPVRRSATLFPLDPNTQYRYRVVVENEFTSEAGAEHAFMTAQVPDPSGDDCPNATFRTGASTRLPDCRAYELVSPLDKNNTNIAGPVLGISQAAVTGNGMTFASFRSFANPEAAPLHNPFVAFRDQTLGWQTHPIAPPRNSVSLYPNGGQNSYPYRAFSPDLCSGWIQHDVAVPLISGAPPGVPNLYRRDLCGDGGYELLSSVAPPGFKFEPIGSTYFPEIMGFSADNKRSVFRANAPLTPNANPTSGFYQTYVSDQGKLRLVSVLPNGSAANSEAVPGDRQFVTLTFRYDNVYRTVSEDASRVFWSMSLFGGNPGKDGDGGGVPQKLYLRLNATEPQSLISGGKCTQPARACTIPISETLGARFESASPDGSRVIYTVNDDLFEADIEEVAGQMTSVPQQIAKGVISVMGSSEDAERIYFASKEVLTEAEQNSEGDSAIAGKANLYLYEKGAGFEFVATLVGWDTDANTLADQARLSPLARTPAYRISRVSPDGMHAAFTSIASLTGYDNADANNGEPDAQVFHYDAASGELACASCNPSGARPKGKRISAGGKGDWAAAIIPGWTTHLQPTRALSDDGGHLFFEAFDALLPRDTNGRKDVYQWEASGSGNCTEESSSFSEQNEGCLSLISSGESPVDSEFLDASPSGEDVFFLTQSSLVDWDPGLADVYDARVDGGLPGPAVPLPACEGEACQGPVAPPNDPTPSSSTYQGPGNVKEAAKQVKKAKSRKAKRKRQQAKRRAQAKRRQAAKRANAKGRAGR